MQLIHPLSITCLLVIGSTSNITVLKYVKAMIKYKQRTFHDLQNHQNPRLGPGYQYIPHFTYLPKQHVHMSVNHHIHMFKKPPSSHVQKNRHIHMFKQPACSHVHWIIISTCSFNHRTQTFIQQSYYLPIHLVSLSTL